MRVLTPAEFLTLWESGDRLTAVERALLAIRSFDANAASVADWPLGRRNQALARIRMLYFGPRLEGWTGCAACGEKLEFELDCERLIETWSPIIADAEYGRPVVVAGRSFRLPTSRDLASIVDSADVRQAALTLLRRCHVGDDAGAGATSAAAPDSSDCDPCATWARVHFDDVAQRLAMADPLAEISLEIECPMCEHRSEDSLDLAAFLWSEIEVRAQQLLFDVDALATRYGWAESAILAMSEARRSAYVRMVST